METNEKTFRYAIIGTGAVGGFYGGMLAKAGFDVHFLVHSDYPQVHQKGLVVKSVLGDFSLPAVNAYPSVEEMPECDVAIVALKATHNYLLKDMLPHVLSKNGTVVLLQNGLGEEAEISTIQNVQHVIAGICFVCVSKTGPGYIHHLDYGTVQLAHYTSDDSPAGITSIMRRIVEDFGNADIPVDCSEDLIESRWRKLVWNIPFNGLSVVLNNHTAGLVNNPDIRVLILDIMKEIGEGAHAFGRTIPHSFIEKMIDDTIKMKPYYPSMKLDFDSGRPLEIETMYYSPIQAALGKNVPLPRTSMLYRQLRFFNSTRKGL